MTDLASCRARQQRLLAEMRRRDIDLVVLTRTEHVQWLTGPRFAWVFEPVAALSADGHCVLVAPTPGHVAAADVILTYQAKWLSTLRNDQRQASSIELLKYLIGRPKPRRIGVEFSSCGPHLTAELKGELFDIEPELYRLRRCKDPDELALVRRAIAATGAMYERARRIVEPGINELDVFNQLQAAAVEELGEMLTGTGNDYACAARGGPPRDRQCQAGELYILDLGPAYRGYFADNCRTLAVGGRPTDAQQAAWERIAAVFELVRSTVKPGLSCRDFYDQVNQQLNEYMPGGFDHHLGHGIGLFPHEAPHLNPNWDDTFQEGEVFAIEPGLYAPELRVGIRLENDYLVTSDGVELLSDFPLGL
ncbi:MAG: Xaa-Pro peptidase family protein [Pirellulales bacterium]